MQMQKFETAGYYLVEVTHDHWVLKVKGGYTFNGKFKEVVTYMVKELGFLLHEIDFGIKQLLPAQEMYKHNAIHFGMYKTFIFTCQEELGRKAG